MREVRKIYKIFIRKTGREDNFEGLGLDGRIRVNSVSRN
jgi:hypothetical protein